MALNSVPVHQAEMGLEMMYLGPALQVLVQSSDDLQGESAAESSDSESSEDVASESEECEHDPKTGIFSRSERSAFFGYIAQYFSVGLIYAGLQATTYGVFLGYLNVPAYIYATVSVVMFMPWSFKFFFGMMNDTLPIRGQHRKPYMVIGWSFCALMLIILWQTPLPPPYWCVDNETGKYIKETVDSTGRRVAATPCHLQSQREGGKYAVLMMLAALGYVVADVAADGLTTEYAKLEPIERRGNIQTTAYFTRTCGSAAVSFFIGFFMNSTLYNGSFRWGLSFNQVCAVLAVPAAIMVPISALLVKEPTHVHRHVSFREYGDMCWSLLSSKAMFFIIMYFFFTPMVGSISTTSGPMVKQYWARVENLQNQIFSLCGHLLFALGLLIVKKKFLHVSWRLILAVTTIGLNLITRFL